jgi:hypothetical protein
MSLGPKQVKRQSKGNWFRYNPSYRLVHLQLKSDATSVMVPRAPHAVALPLFLRVDWETRSRLPSKRSKTLDLNVFSTSLPHSVGFLAQPTNCSMLGSEVQTKKPSRWFWDLNHQTVAAGFEVRIGKPSTTLVLRLNQKIHHRFWDQTGRNRHYRFWDQPVENRPNGFDVKPLTNRRPWFWGSTKKLTLFISMCTV